MPRSPTGLISTVEMQARLPHSASRAAASARSGSGESAGSARSASRSRSTRVGRSVAPVPRTRRDGRLHDRAYPVADHIADKVCTLVEIHPRVGRPGQVTTRYRDLADLAVIANTQSVDASALRKALASEASRRGIELPTTFTAPDAAGWRAGYARVARDVPRLAERDFEAASAMIKRFLDPILGGDVAGSWRPDRQRWCSRPPRAGDGSCPLVHRRGRAHRGHVAGWSSRAQEINRMPRAAMRLPRP